MRGRRRRPGLVRLTGLTLVVAVTIVVLEPVAKVLIPLLIVGFILALIVWSVRR
jgi:hypothetical protein